METILSPRHLSLSVRATGEEAALVGRQKGSLPEQLGLRRERETIATCTRSLVGRVVAFTTPLQYRERFQVWLRDEGAQPLWCPTIGTEPSHHTREQLRFHLQSLNLGQVHGIAFTSRAGMRAIADVLDGRQLSIGTFGIEDPFLVGALGQDADLVEELNLIARCPGVAMVVPAIATPQALVEALGNGRGRKLLCPVPVVEGLEEPPVVPQFLKDLSTMGWDPVRVNSYVTHWLGPNCAKPLLDPSGSHFAAMDALVFTSTAEVEGLLKSLLSLGLGVEALSRGRRKFLVAAHGPVTALGAERLGVEVDVVGKEFQSFAGVIRALEAECGCMSHVSP